MKYIVYKTTCLVNNKIYVGVHQTKNPEIFDGYLGRGLYKNHSKYIKNPVAPFHYAVKKYGFENFKREVLFIFNSREDAYNKESEIVNEEFILRNDTYNVALGGIGRPRPSRYVYQFDFNGNLIATYESAVAASKTVGINVSNINDAIYSKRTSAGSLWSDSDTINIQEYTITKENIYYIYNESGQFIKAASNKEYIEFLNTDRGNLARAIKLQNKIKGYFISLEKLDNFKVNVTKLNGKLNRYSLKGEYIDSFDSIADAKKILNLKLCSISQAIKLGRQCNGYRWTRTDNPTPTITIN